MPMAYSNIITHQRIVSGLIFLLALIQLIQLPAARSVDTNPGTIKVKPPSSPEPAKPQAPAQAAPAPQTSAPPPRRWQGQSQRTNWRAPAPKPKPVPKVYGCNSQGPITGLPPKLEIGVPVDCLINNASLVRDKIRMHEYHLDVAEGEKVLLKLAFDPSLASGAYPSLEIKEIGQSKKNGGLNSLSATVDGSNKKKSASYVLDAPYASKFRLLVSARLYGVGIEIARSDSNEALYIRSVKRGSQADLIGFRPGDLLLSINKKSTKDLSVEEAVNRLRGSDGSNLSFVLKRQDASLAILIPSSRLDGVELAKSVPDTDLLVSAVKKGSPSDSFGVKPGDILRSINKKPTNGLTIDEVMNRLRGPEGSKVSFALRRKDGSISVLIPRSTLEVQDLFEYRYTLTAELVSRRKAGSPISRGTDSSAFRTTLDAAR